MIKKAVILAGGRGTRMRRAGGEVELSSGQQAAAQRGLKGMIPVAGDRPFLDYVVSGLADSGCREVCLVLGSDPDHAEIRSYYEGRGRPARVAIRFATQQRPRGTADAVLAAEAFAAGEPALFLNADNLYPRQALEALRELPRAGLAGFRRSTLVETIPAERILAFALIATDAEGCLTRIIEKPAPAEAAAFGADPLVSMNLWLLPPTIYRFCRAVPPSSRGELELADAIAASIALGERYRMVEIAESVLDLSSPADIPLVSARLRGHEVAP